MKKFAMLFAVLLFWASLAFGQRGGIPTFSAADVHEFDSINLQTLVPSFNFPVISTPGAVPYSLKLESIQACYPFYSVANSQYYWSCDSVSSSGVNAALDDVTSSLVGTTIQFTKGTSVGCDKFTITGLVGSDGLTFYPISTTPIIYHGTGCTPTSATVSTVDGSGITATINSTNDFPQFTSIYDPSGIYGSAFSLSVGYVTTVKDPFGNALSETSTTLGGSITLSGSDGNGDYSTYGYTDSNGHSQSVTLTQGSSVKFSPLTPTTGSWGSCIGTINENITPVSTITYPDSTTIGIGWLTNGNGNAGLINSITLRTGGTISYTYGTPDMPGNCTNPGTWTFPTLSRATADGTTNYSRSVSSGVTTTTVLDPGKNKTVYTFGGSTFITEIDRYQNTGTVASPTYTLISTTKYCYNSPCTTTPTYPITIRQTDEYLGSGSTHMSQRIEDYDSYGNTTSDAVTDEINSQTITTTTVYGTYSSGSCSAITNTEIVDHPCTVTTKNGSTWLSESTYTYNSNGALTSSSVCLSSTCTGSSALTTTYTPTTQGTYSAIQAPNGQTTNYTYGSCNSLMPTDVTTTVNSVAIDNKMTWNCNAAVVTDTTDANSNEDDYAYDSMNRLSSYTDRLENVTSYAYGTPTLDHVKVTDPLSVVSYQYVDGLGRPTNSQVCQTTGCSNLDTSSKSYAWNGVNFETKIYVPCVQTVLNTACTTVALTSDANPIAGPTLSTDANSGTLTYAVNSKDFSVTAGPAPSQENTKVLQTEVDGFGRVNSVCALTSTGYNGRVSCGQTMGNSGTLTSSTFTYAAGSYEVDTTRGSQTNKNVVDAIGRTTSTTTPEAGTTTYTFDTVAANYCSSGSAYTSSGNLVAMANPAGNHICFANDGLRVTDVTNGNQTTTNFCKRYRYDSTANKYVTGPSGYPSSGTNIIGEMFEAETDDCAGTTLTDEWFAYDKMERMTDMWEKSPNSNGYTHTAVGFNADGVVTSLSGIPNYSSMTFGVDGEGRPFNSQYGTTWVVGSSSTTGVSYDAASRPLTVPINSASGHSDVYTWDNVGNMSTYTFSGNSKSMAGTLTWNSIGSLNKLAITDSFNSGGAQTCTYGTSTVEGYDDVGRLLDANCGSTIQHDSWTYDQYDNATRTGNPGTSWNPGYSSTNNEMTGSTYDGDGNVKYDGVNTYTWNIFSQMNSVNAGSTAAVCGTSGSCVTYDALGRYVEMNDNTNGFREVLYSPIGRIAVQNGSATVFAYIPQPGGGMLYASGATGTVLNFQHPDWLGTKRLSTVLTTGASSYDTAFTPYGESYDTFGSLQPEPDFTGDPQDIYPTLLDTPNRELMQNAGRWLSPDPAGASWNAYAYPTDPNTQTDPSGLRECNSSDQACVTATPDEVGTSTFGELYCVAGCIGGNLIFRQPNRGTSNAGNANAGNTNGQILAGGPSSGTLVDVSVPDWVGTDSQWKLGGELSGIAIGAYLGTTYWKNENIVNMVINRNAGRFNLATGRSSMLPYKPSPPMSYQDTMMRTEPTREWNNLLQEWEFKYNVQLGEWRAGQVYDNIVAQEELQLVTKSYAAANVVALTLPMNGSHQSWFGEGSWRTNVSMFWKHMKVLGEASASVAAGFFGANQPASSTWPF